MRKLFTLIALSAVCMGAKADEWVEDYSINYTTYQGFPFYVMGYVPSFDYSAEVSKVLMRDDGAMWGFEEIKEGVQEGPIVVTTQNGVKYNKTKLEEAAWHQYFIADGIPTQIGQTYKVSAMVRASEPVTINVNMGWGWGDGEQQSQSVSIGTEWEEVEWTYYEIGGSSCNLVAQPGTSTAVIEWEWLTVGHNQKESKPVEWIEWLENGDASNDWAAPDTKYNDTENNYKICAWSKSGGGDPVPSPIEEVDGNRAFVVHATDCPDLGGEEAWYNQFWIESPKAWAAGDQIRISFRYKASQDVTTNTQAHNQNPSSYLIWHCLGDISFTTEWQQFSKTITVESDMAGMWSVAFNLNPNVKTATDFYFDDMKWETMKLDEGYFVAGDFNDWNLDEAVEFAWDDTEAYWVTSVGTEEKPASSIKISTKRGNDAAFDGALLKVTGDIVNDPDNWMDYTKAYQKMSLPEPGIWIVRLDPEYQAMSFELADATAIKTVNLAPVKTNAIYNLAGQKVNANFKGVGIQNGKKLLMK